MAGNRVGGSWLRLRNNNCLLGGGGKLTLNSIIAKVIFIFADNKSNDFLRYIAVYRAGSSRLQVGDDAMGHGINGGQRLKISDVLVIAAFALLFGFGYFDAAAAISVNPEIKSVREAGQCLSLKETSLLNLVNDYRRSHGLLPVTLSRSLTKVAQSHAWDLVSNSPASGVDNRGEKCSLHSWSEKGSWTPVCYTRDNLYAEKMWNKPREITNYLYTGNGYENAYWTSEPEVSVEKVLQGWKRSPGHNSIILENGGWEGMRWPAIGVGIKGNVAVIWFGDASDPADPISECEGVAAGN